MNSYIDLKKVIANAVCSVSEKVGVGPRAALRDALFDARACEAVNDVLKAEIDVLLALCNGASYEVPAYSWEDSLYAKVFVLRLISELSECGLLTDQTYELLDGRADGLR